MVCVTWGRQTVIDDRFSRDEWLAFTVPDDNCNHPLASPVDLDLFNHVRRLYTIVSQVFTSLYSNTHPVAHNGNDAARAASIVTLESLLKDWVAGLPPDLQFYENSTLDDVLVLGDSHKRAFLRNL